jgi:hypothetical protein
MPDEDQPYFHPAAPSPVERIPTRADLLRAAMLGMIAEERLQSDRKGGDRKMGKNDWLLRSVLAAHKRPPSLLTQRFAQRYIEAMVRHEPEPDPTDKPK